LLRRNGAQETLAAYPGTNLGLLFHLNFLWQLTLRRRLFEFLSIFPSRTFPRSKDKWNSSGASDAVAQASASIPESTKTYVSSLFKREHLRGITVYFGIGEERPFYLEKNPALLLERLRHNVSFFYLNYMLLTGVLFCLTLLISPSAIIGIAILALAWMWVIRASQTGSLAIGGTHLQLRAVVVLGRA